ncbi:hypothetical protein KKF38_01225 [Patescibacteria group bacterium]|nr:hypothetical protein [Patescibacteria group bacterium]
MNTEVISNLIENIRGSFGDLWLGIIDILPRIVEGIVILIVGWIVAKVISRLVGKIVEVIRLERILATAGVKDFFQKAGVKLSVEGIFEEIVKWFILIAFFISAANAFGLPQVNSFLQDVLNYIPNVIIASVITIVGILIANFFADLAHSTTKATKTGSPQIVASITRYAVIIFTVFAALVQLGIGKTLLDSFFNNLGLALAAAFGLAFGLGGKEAAADVIKRIKKDVSLDKK